MVCALKVRRSIEIIEAIPTERLGEIGEKYIILGEIVVSNAAISTRKESVEQFFSPLKTDTENIAKQVKLIVPTIATSAKKGEVTVESMFQSLQSHFIDDSFEDVSGTGKFGDLLAITSGSKILILIELKKLRGDSANAGS